MIKTLIARPALGIIFAFIFVAFAWRLVSALYIDVLGPLFSEQLDRDIGPGISAVPLALSQAIVIAMVLYSFRPERLKGLYCEADAWSEKGPRRYLRPLSDLAFWAAGIFIFLLWIEMFARGPIPLFADMERYDYARLYAGPLHRRLLQWGPMLAFQLGIFLAAPMLRGRLPDRRFVVLFAALILYLFFVGHRFSSFFAYTTFLVIPVGAVLLVKQGRTYRPWREMLPKRGVRYLYLAGGALALLVGLAVLHSYTAVRGVEGSRLVTKLVQRILVQQSEMWWMTYERVFLQQDWSSSFAAFKIFIAPFDPSRNSTMQFLMELGLPIERAHVILEQGTSYTGGWPEVLFELAGPLGGFVLVAFCALMLSEFMFLLVRCIVLERFVSCVFLTPVMYTVMIFVTAGMANSFIQLTFLFKVAVAIVTYLVEVRWQQSYLVRSESNDGACVAQERTWVSWWRDL
ncbi:MAG TPA: DUF6418 domain-containing protein [Bradyrhizobium sp.]|nr:DUF6418 domain-containing protein [Bradyrhizobium sp.]